MIIVDIGRKRSVSVEGLVQACISAAEKLGYRAKAKNVVSREFNLEHGHYEDLYKGTNVRVSRVVCGVEIPLLRVGGSVLWGTRKNNLQSFHVLTGLGYGLAREATVHQYLATVRQSLDEIAEERPALKVV